MSDGAATPEVVEELKRQAATHLAEGRPEEARARYSEALRMAPQDLEARNGLVRCTVILGQGALSRREPQRAISHFQLALELSPFHPDADAGLREAARMEGAGAARDPVGAALEALPPVKALRDLQAADRVVGKITGTGRPTQVLSQTLDARRADLSRGGAPPRERRIEHEMAAAWRRRWVYRALPVAIAVAAVLLWTATGATPVLWWGALLGGFAAVWDWVFVERGQQAAARLAQP